MINILVPIKEISGHYEIMLSTVKKYIGLENVNYVELFDEFEGESFAHKINRGILKTEGDIVILHTDMCVLEEWFKVLLVYVNTDRIGILGSKMMFASNPKVIQHFGGAITYNGDAVHPHRGVIDTGHYDYCNPVPFVTFGGCYIKRLAIDEVGYLDEAIQPWGGEDIDYCLRAAKQGFLVICTPATLWHDESKDAKTLPELDKIIKRNMDYVRKKHKLEIYNDIPKWV